MIYSNYGSSKWKDRYKIKITDKHEIDTYIGLQVFGSVAIMPTTNAKRPHTIHRNMENVHFRINGQFQWTNAGSSSVHVIVMSPIFVIRCGRS